MSSLIQMLVVFALLLGAMIVIHEFGHFIVAKLFGVRVETFSVGFGKRLWGVRRGDTDYRISLIPLGGYVKMAGESLDDQVTGAPYEFTSKPKWQRLCIAFAGPAMNILTALAIPATMGMIHLEEAAYLNRPAIVDAVDPSSPAEEAGLQRGDRIVRIDGQQDPTWRDLEDRITLSPDQVLPITFARGNETKEAELRLTDSMFDRDKIGYSGLQPPDYEVVVGDVTPGSPSDEAGLKSGDRIVEVNGSPIQQSNRGREMLIRTIQSSEGQPVSLRVKRDGNFVEMKATPRVMDDGVLRLGFTSMLQNSNMIATRLPPGRALKYSINTNLRILRLTRDILGQVLAGKRSPRDTLAGPIQIARISGEAAKQGAGSVFDLMGMLSLNLGVVNLLPIPVLDGGLIFMLLLEAGLGLVGLPLTLRIKERMLKVGFVVIMLLMAFVIINDISKYFPSHSGTQQTEQPKQPPKK